MNPMPLDAPPGKRRNPSVFILLLFSLLFCVSCAEKPTPTAPPPSPPPALPSTGEVLFLNLKLPEALEQFEHDYDTALADSDRRQALYGLACTQMALATGDEQLAQAVANLELWIEQNQGQPEEHNPRLLVIALKVQSERWQKRGQELARTIRQKNGVIVSQRKKITAMADTVDSLQKQLEELEAIDETLQEKKKSL